MASLRPFRSGGSWLVVGFQEPTASENDSLTEGMKIEIGKGWFYAVVKLGDLLIKHGFRLVTLGIERVQRIGELIVENREAGNGLLF